MPRDVVLFVHAFACCASLGTAKPWEADEAKLLEAQVKIKGGYFKFGVTDKDERHADGVNPQTFAGSGAAKRSKVKSFAIDAAAVTNDQFRRFVRDTKYETEAEKFKWSFVHEKLLSAEQIKIADGETGMGRIKETPHWVAVQEATWRRPEGPDSSVRERGDHPAVHISWNDAQEYCRWANGRRLPTEKEWEYAARGGLDDEPFPWGEQAGKDEMNGWQGEFPKENTADDGYIGIAPVRAYSKPNPYGLHNMVGNIWEWCSGGKSEQSRPLRGGSYVDSIDGRHNHALRVWTRMENSPDSGSHNTGFRCASGKNDNKEDAPKPPAPPKPRKKASDLDQAKIQEVLAERGAEGLNEWLAEQGVGAQAMTPAQLQKKRDELKKMREQLKEMDPGLKEDKVEL